MTERRDERQALRSITERPLGSAPGRGWIAAVVVLAIATAAALAYGLYERTRWTAVDEERIAAAVRADSLALAVALRDSLLAAQPSVGDLLPVLVQPDLAAFPLSGPGDARGALVASAGGALLAASGLPAETRYALWHENDLGARPIASLGDAPQGYLFALLADAEFASGWGAIRVVREGSDEPRPEDVLLEYRGRLR